MANVFNSTRLGYKLVSAKFEWNVKVPYTRDTETKQGIRSPLFSSPETSDTRQLELNDERESLRINVFLKNEAIGVPILEPVNVNIKIFDTQNYPILEGSTQHTLERKNGYSIEFQFQNKKAKVHKTQYPCRIYCEIFWQVKTSTSSADSPVLAMDCSGALLTQLQGLFDEMKFSDVVFNINGHEFPAHKLIIATRSAVFADMFQYPPKEFFTTRITIEDIEPEIFKELLRFIYTGRLTTTTMQTMAAGLFIAADRYLLDELKNECEKYLLRQMSPENCIELILGLHLDLLNPPEHLKEVLKEATKRFQLLQSEVMATTKWEKMEKENPQILFKILKIVLSKKV